MRNRLWLMACASWLVASCGGSSSRPIECEESDCRGSRPAALQCGALDEAIALCENVNGSCEWIAPTGCPDPDDGTPCRVDEDCGDGEFCASVVGSTNACPGPGAWGECSPRPSFQGCEGEIGQVCGCDGDTYDSYCHATASGVPVRLEMPCPTPVETGGSCTVGGRAGRCFSSCPDHLVDGDVGANVACGSPTLNCCVARTTR